MRRLLILILIAQIVVAPGAWARDEEDELVKLEKKLRYQTLDEARAALTPRLLMPPVNLGAKKPEVQRRLGTPKEIVGFGSELYNTKEGTVQVSYTSDSNGDVIVNGVEYRPKKEIVWSTWLKSSVQLPRPQDAKSKVRLTTQIRIEDIGANRSLQITMIGNQRAVTFINWALIL